MKDPALSLNWGSENRIRRNRHRTEQEPREKRVQGRANIVIESCFAYRLCLQFQRSQPSPRFHYWSFALLSIGRENWILFKNSRWYRYRSHFILSSSPLVRQVSQEALLQFRGKKLLDEAGILQFPLHFQSFHSLIQKDTSELPSSIRLVLLYLTK